MNKENMEEDLVGMYQNAIKESLVEAYKEAIVNIMSPKVRTIDNGALYEEACERVDYIKHEESFYKALREVCKTHPSIYTTIDPEKIGKDISDFWIYYETASQQIKGVAEDLFIAHGGCVYEPDLYHEIKLELSNITLKQFKDYLEDNDDVLTKRVYDLNGHDVTQIVHNDCVKMQKGYQIV